MWLYIIAGVREDAVTHQSPSSSLYAILNGTSCINRFRSYYSILVGLIHSRRKELVVSLWIMIFCSQWLVFVKLIHRFCICIYMLSAQLGYLSHYLQEFLWHWPVAIQLASDDVISPFWHQVLIVFESVPTFLIMSNWNIGSLSSCWLLKSSIFKQQSTFLQDLRCLWEILRLTFMSF